MTDHDRDFKDHLIDRELREVLGGDGPPAGLEARIVAAVERRRSELTQADPTRVAATPPTPAQPAARPASNIQANRNGNGSGSGNGRVPSSAGSGSDRRRVDSGRRRSGQNGAGRSRRPRQAGDRSHQNNVRWIAPVVSVAASVLVMIGVGIAFWPETPVNNTVAENQNRGNDVRPPKNMVVHNDPQDDPGNGAGHPGGNLVVNADPGPRRNQPTNSNGPDNANPRVPGPDDGNNATVDRNVPDANRDNTPAPPDNVPPGPGPIQPEQPGPTIDNSSQPDSNQPIAPDNTAPPGPGPIDQPPQDPVVDNPTPPGPIEPGPTVEARPVLASVMVVDGSSRLRVQRPNEPGQPENDWEAYDEDAHKEFVAGTRLKSRGTIDLNLRTGALLRFDGEIALNGDEDHTQISVAAKDSVYVDNMGSPGTVSVGIDEHVASVRDGIAFFEAQQGWMRVSAIHGDIEAGGQPLPAGRMMALRDRKNEEGDVDPGLFRNRFFRDMPGRVVIRDDFDEARDAAVRIQAGEVEDGLLHARRAEQTVRAEVGFHPYRLTGTEVLRIRYRFSHHGQRLAIEVGNRNVPRMRAGTVQDPVRGGAWQEVEIPLASLMMRGKEAPPPPRRQDGNNNGGNGRPQPPREAPLPAGATLDMLALFAGGEKAERPEGLQLQIDWIEIVRQPQR